MLLMDLKKLTKVSLVVGLLMAMIFGYFCINTFTHHRMGIEVVSNTSSIMQSVESCCSSTFSKYSESLRSNFNLPSRADDYLLVLIISIVLASAVNLYLRSITYTNNGFPLRKLFLRQNPDIFAFNSLKLAFSNRIINPKVF